MCSRARERLPMPVRQSRNTTSENNEVNHMPTPKLPDVQREAEAAVAGINSMSFDALQTEVNSRLHKQFPTWRGNIGKGMLGDAVKSSKLLSRKEDLVVTPTYSDPVKGAQPKKAIRRKKK